LVPPPPGGSGTGEPPPPEGSSIPFENAATPFLDRLLETVKLAITDPVRLFSAVNDDSDIWQAVLYALIFGTLSSAMASMWQIVWGGMLGSLDPFVRDGMVMGTGFQALMILFSPVWALLGLFIGSGIFHVSLYVLGYGGRGFPVTLRVVAYASTPTLLAVVPFCGGLIGMVWSIVLVVLGATYAHGTEWWRALLAYLIFPAIVCCCMAFGMSMLLGMIGVAQ
jgi:hypothetical protein